MVRHLYVHIPFCAKICPYCNFYKSPAAAGGLSEFVEAVIAEARCRAGEIAPETVFFGGGTPTVLNVNHLRRLISGLQEHLDFSGVREFTVEMNPATVSSGKAEALLGLGVNRVSLGVQSWEPRLLQMLGRAHSCTMALESFRILRAAGFANINLDHIYGIPTQTLPEWRRTLDASLDLGPDHISAYSLTFEEDTPYFLQLKHGELAPDPTLDAELFELTHTVLENAGFRAYETSNFSRPGRECKHNLAIWRGCEYLGLGPSAVGTIGHVRRRNAPDTAAYVSCAGGDPPSTDEHLSSRQLRLERLALGLRLEEGVDEDLLPAQAASRLEIGGFLTRSKGRISLARHARALADELLLELV